jgi:hypothetical protein
VRRGRKGPNVGAADQGRGEKEKAHHGQFEFSRCLGVKRVSSSEITRARASPAQKRDYELREEAIFAPAMRRDAPP